MEYSLIELLSSETETEVLEFKKAKQTFSKDKLGQYFSALGNEANLKGKAHAYLLFGIDNETHRIVGTDISDKQINEFKKEIADHTSPKLGFVDVQREETEQGTVIIFLTLTLGHPKPIF